MPGQAYSSKAGHKVYAGKAAIVQAVINDHLNGYSLRQIADKHHISTATACNWVKRFRASDDKQLPSIGPSGNLGQPARVAVSDSITDYRATLRNKAVKAVELGLDCPDDPYKAGNLGVSVLKGIGDFADSQPTSALTVLLSAMPASVASELSQVIDLSPLTPTSDGSNDVADRILDNSKALQTMMIAGESSIIGNDGDDRGQESQANGGMDHPGGGAAAAAATPPPKQ